MSARRRISGAARSYAISLISEDDSQANSKWNEAVSKQQLDAGMREQFTFSSGKELGSALAETFSLSSELRKASALLATGQVWQFSKLAKELLIGA